MGNELDDLRRDAARYRFLVDFCTSEDDDGNVTIKYQCSFDHFRDPDASIDAAITQRAATLGDANPSR